MDLSSNNPHFGDSTRGRPPRAFLSNYTPDKPHIIGTIDRHSLFQNLGTTYCYTCRLYSSWLGDTGSNEWATGQTQGGGWATNTCPTPTQATSHSRSTSDQSYVASFSALEQPHRRCNPCCRPVTATQNMEYTSVRSQIFCPNHSLRFPAHPPVATIPRMQYNT